MAFPTPTPPLPDPWPFEDAPNTACLTTKHIIHEAYPVLYVSRSSKDGTWQFHYSGPVSMSDALLVGIGTVYQSDPTIVEIADLPPGWEASRDKPDAPWTREQSPPQPDDDEETG